MRDDREVTHLAHVCRSTVYNILNKYLKGSKFTYFSKIGTANQPSTTAPAATYDITAIDRF